MSEPTPVNKTTPDIKAEQLAKLAELFPEVMREGQVDFELLKATLGEENLLPKDGYRFTWAGKDDVFRAIQEPSAATLIPVEDDSINWDETKNLFIEGENLEVLKLLYKSYRGRIKMIYIDPPYNTGNDFVYSDDYSEPARAYLEKTGQIDESGNVLRSNPETNGRFHSDWLNMMYPRLFLARQLLRDDGVIFVSIDDTEVANLRLLMNEIFGEANFVANIVWQKKYSPQNDAKWLSNMHDHILLYAKNKEIWRPTPLPRTQEQNAAYKNPDNDPRGPWKSTDATSNKNRFERPNLYYPVINPITGEEIYPPEKRVWRSSRELFEQYQRDNRIWWGTDGTNTVPALKSFLSEVRQGRVPSTWWTYKDAGHNQLARQELDALIYNSGFDTPKPSKLIEQIVQIGTNKNDLVLDFFAGSGTTAHAIMNLNLRDEGKRKYILVQIPEVIEEETLARKSGFQSISDITKERIKQVGKKLQPSEKELKLKYDEDLGFKVFRLSSSTFEQWPNLEHPEDFADQLELFTGGVREAIPKLHIQYELIIKEGLDFHATITPVESITSNEITHIGDGRSQFYLCLDKRIQPETFDALLEQIPELNSESAVPFICLDTALTDSQKLNFSLQCRLKTI